MVKRLFNHDIIFCRTVTIYLDEKLKMEVMEKMHKALKPGGYLIIGFYDMMPQQINELFQVYNSEAKIYKKI